MVLSDRTIKKLLEDGSLSISPLEEMQIQPASVDIRLGDTYSVVEDLPSGIISLDAEIPYKTIRAERYLLLPGQFVLATTMEYISLPDDLTAFVEGRSSLGRMGLFIQNAGWVDPGFRGRSRWSCSTPIAAPLNCGPDGVWGNWCLPEWMLRQQDPTLENIRDREGPPAPGSTWIRCNFWPVRKSLDWV